MFSLTVQVSVCTCPHLQPHRDSCGAAADTSPSAPKGATVVQQCCHRSPIIFHLNDILKVNPPKKKTVTVYE